METAGIYIIQGENSAGIDRLGAVSLNCETITEDGMQQRGYSFWIVGLSVLIGVGALLLLYMLLGMMKAGAAFAMGWGSSFLPF